MAALVDVAVRIGALVVDVPEVVELDLNPVIAGPHGALTVDVRIGVKLAPASASMSR